jgi:hypothetical protein
LERFRKKIEPFSWIASIKKQDSRIFGYISTRLWFKSQGIGRDSVGSNMYLGTPPRKVSLQIDKSGMGDAEKRASEGGGSQKHEQVVKAMGPGSCYISF